MSLLLRLLTTGKSLVGLKDEINRYRYTTRNRLPKFGSAKNPFQRSADAGTAGRDVVAATLSPKLAPGAEVRDGVVPPASLPKPAAAQSETDRGTNAQATAASPRTEQSQGNGLRRLRSWLSPSGRPTPKPPVVGGKIPVQCELSLDRVKVMRNDLSDADLEIVTVRPSGTKILAPAVAPAAVLGAMPTRVARATTRLLSALKT
jgi:hypothetical protein